MNMKNTICFILLLFLLLGVASAADCNNETLHQKIEQTDNHTCQVNLEDTGKLEANNADKQKLEASVKSTLTQEKLKVTIKSSNVKMHYKDGSKFSVTLKDSLKHSVKNVKIKITIDGKTYTKITDSKGKASLDLNLKSGKYDVTTTYGGGQFYKKASAKNTVSIKSTIKANDLTKYYKNKAIYSAKFYDKKGKLLKESSVKFKLNTKTYTVKTKKKGIGKLDIDLMPGKYGISLTNSKTSESVTKTITIKSLIETADLKMTERDGSKFSVKVLNSNGKASPNKKITLKVNGVTYTPKTNTNGIATQAIDLKEGNYTITTEYMGLKNTNHITVNKNLTKTIKKSPYTHTTIIPNYVNVTLPYAFHNSEYSLEIGNNGTVKMPKNEIFIVEIASKVITFTTGNVNNSNAIIMNYTNYFVPLCGCGIISEVNINDLKDPGIILTRTPTSTEITYNGITSENIESFGVFADKNGENSEKFTYMKNDEIIANVTVQTLSFDENGVKYSLAKLYNKEDIYFPYSEIIKLTANPVIFTNTKKSVTYSNNTDYIAGYSSKEDIITKFVINGHEEVEKAETISYGLADKYRKSLGFEVLQTYTIINEKVTEEIMENWLANSSLYITRYGAMNVYGMHMASLETAWLADAIADNYASEFNVSWFRDNTLTILGGINLDDTYINILNADMGMNVSGDESSSKLFRLLNSIYLPYIEDYVLTPVADRYLDNTTNSLDNVLSSVENNNFSIVQMGEIFYIICEGLQNSAIVLNSTSGVCEVILLEDNTAYKGSMVPTTCDCCGVGTGPKDIVRGIKNTFNKLKNNLNNVINGVLGKIHPLSILGYMAGNLGVGIAGKLMTAGTTLGLASSVGMMMGIQSAGNYVKNNFVDKKDWHWAYEHVTFTRDGYMQNKKFFNIPKSDGTYDYVEVGINSDGSLNRNDALYVGNGYTKKLTKKETYKYFTEEKWTAYNIPQKYQKHKLPSGI